VAQHIGAGPRREHGGVASTRTVDRPAVAPGRPGHQAIPEDKSWHLMSASAWCIEDHECTDRQVDPGASVAALRLAVAAVGVQAAVHRVDLRSLPERRLPTVEPGVEVRPAAQGAGAVARRQRHRLVPEEQRGPAPWLPFRSHPALVLQDTGDPPAYLPRPHDLPIAVHASPVAHEEAPLVDGDDLAPRVHPIPVRHPTIVARRRARSLPSCLARRGPEVMRSVTGG
jgi:hypothetical protein